jgi:NAD(P)-dependent dehydrogenase (short-subunit alcohol dehydrogenase family)
MMDRALNPALRTPPRGLDPPEIACYRPLDFMGIVDVNVLIDDHHLLQIVVAVESSHDDILWFAIALLVNLDDEMITAGTSAGETRVEYIGKISLVFKGTPMMLHYVTSKAAVVALTRCLAREVGDDGIRVNCIAPGLVMSDNVRANPAWAAQLVVANVATRAIKRDAEPEDLIGALLFLSSADSDFMTGQTIVVDGGSVMH